jgi:autotransporter-associated beta strand protein
VTVNIANGGSITVNGTGSATIPTSSIGGHAGDIADVNISGTMTYGSGTNLAIGSTSGTTTVDINNGGILNLNNSARSVAIAASGTVTINSGGTMTSARTWGASTGNLVLAGGTFQATAAQTLASGLLISTTSANSTIDTNGNAVSISSGISGAGGLIKAGTNTLTLSGANTYTGNTTINAGGLTLASTGSMLFRITDISNSEILGTGTGAFDGTFKLDLSGVTASNTWTLVDVGSLTGLSYGGTFSVADNAGSITFNNSGGTWTGIASGVGTYTFTQSTGQLTFTAVPEPHEFALAIVALLGVMVFIRRRNQQV